MFSIVGKAHAATITWPSSVTSISGIVNSILPIFYGIVGIALFGLFLYGGFLWLTSAGDADKVRKGVDTMLNAVIGVGIIIFAYFMTRAVAGILGFDLI
ncbi:MAG: hypothetical protein PHG63_03335 [Candidatus Dojkabacteria bacterium]|nr:hypothetical protein [Candidatus Dojkabacteria bacterium]